MFRNFLKTTLRSLLRDKYYSLINIAGLAIGLAVTILIILFIYDELTFDRFHTMYERVYRLESDFTLDNKHLKAAVTQVPLGPTLKDEYPEIEEFTRCLPIGTMYLRYGEKDFQEDSIWYADSTFFRLFTHIFIYGDPNTALVKPNTMVVTKSFAQRYFGDRDPVGESAGRRARAGQLADGSDRPGEALGRGLAELAHGHSLRTKVTLSPSTTSLPRSPAISRRLVPGASPVEVTKTPVAPLAYSR